MRRAFIFVSGLLLAGAADAATKQQLVDAELSLMRLTFACGETAKYKTIHEAAKRTTTRYDKEITVSRSDVADLHRGLRDGNIDPEIDKSTCSTKVEDEWEDYEILRSERLQ